MGGAGAVGRYAGELSPCGGSALAVAGQGEGEGSQLRSEVGGPDGSAGRR